MHTKDTTKQKDLKDVAILRAQLRRGGGVQQTHLVLAARKNVLDTALLNLQAFGRSQIGGHPQLGGHRAEQEASAAGIGLAGDGSVFQGGPWPQLGIQVLDHKRLWVLGLLIGHDKKPVLFP